MVKLYDGKGENRQIPNYQNRLLIVGNSRSGQTNALLNLINHRTDIEQIFLYTNEQFEVKYD